MSEWQPIKTAPKVAGTDIIGSRWYPDSDGKMTCVREYFVSFWSPTLNKFYCDPTHWMPAPPPPQNTER